MTATATITFVADPRVEAWLKSYDVNFTGPTPIKLSDIDRKASRHNQARREALTAEGVERYSYAIKNGQELPAVVVHRVGNKYVIIDGNHRDQSALNEKKEKIRAYIIDPQTPSETITLMTIAANTMNGIAVDKAWALENALHLVELGYDNKAVAKALNVSVNSIESHYKDRIAGDRARNLNVSNWNKMPVGVRITVARIHLDKPFVIVAEAAIASGTPLTSEFKAFVAELNKAADQTTAVEMATQWAHAVIELAKQQARMGKVRNTNNPKMGLITGLGKIKAFNLGIFNATFATDEDRKTINKRIDEVLAALTEMKCRLNGRDATQEQLLTLAAGVDTKE